MKLASLVRQQVHALDADLPVDRLKPMTPVISESIADVRIVTGLVGGFVIFAPALAAVRLIASFLYGVSSRDISVLTIVPLLLLAVALLASYLPARHATKIDPLDALRAE